jgi:Tfp pilus assembly PilM family ATPase
VKLVRANRTPIGLDLAGREIKAIQLSRTSAGNRVEAALILPRPELAALDAPRAAWLADVLARQGFRGNRVVCAAPVARLEAEMLELPPRASGAPVEQIARAELATVTRITDGFEVTCWDIPSPPRGGTGTSLLAVGLRHADADALLDPLESSGLDVRAIDARACALARAITATGAADSGTLDDRPHLLLDLEWESGFVVLIHRRTVLFQRTLTEVGFGALYRAVAAQFDLTEDVTDFLLTNPHGEDRAIDAADATAGATHRARVAALIAQYAAGVTDELEQSFAFARHRYPDLAPRGLLISGAGARVVGLCDQLAGRLRADVTPVFPAARVACADALVETCRNPALTTALGLALHEEIKQP